MNSQDWTTVIALSGIVVTLVVTLINNFYVRKNLRYSKFYEALTPIRTKEYQDLQQSLMEVVKMAYYYKYQNDNQDFSFSLIKCQILVSDEQKEILTLLSQMQESTTDSLNDDLKEKAEKLAKLAKRYLRTRWSELTFEAELRFQRKQPNGW